jgi:hypothetical protein
VSSVNDIANALVGGVHDTADQTICSYIFANSSVMQILLNYFVADDQWRAM